VYGSQTGRDPLSTQFFAVAVQAALNEIDEDIMDLHPGSDTARAAAFADDGIVVGELCSCWTAFPTTLPESARSPTSTSK
jgi:hypothetical protein